MTQSDYRVPMRAGLAIEAHASEPAYVGLAAACRVAVAEELRAQAAIYAEEADRERKRASRLLAAGSPKWQCESSIASAQELRAVAIRLAGRADALDPEGATR